MASSPSEGSHVAGPAPLSPHVLAAVRRAAGQYQCLTGRSRDFLRELDGRAMNASPTDFHSARHQVEDPRLSPRPKNLAHGKGGMGPRRRTTGETVRFHV